MTFPATDPRDSGLLTLSDGAELWWDVSGSPDGRPMVWLHGGPGSGLGRTYARRLDPTRWNVVGLDQRACGRSRPLATAPGFDLGSVTTRQQVADLEELREHLGLESWLVAGGSWGSTLALAYAETHPERVTGLVLTAVTTSSHEEVEWISERVGRVFPREWDELVEASGRRPGQPLLEAYLERLTAADPAVRLAAACAWEDAHVSLDPAHEPRLHRRWPAGRLVVVDGEGRGGTTMSAELEAAYPSMLG